jgi:hypothetical protein
MPSAAKAQLDAAVHQSFLLQASADAGLCQQVHRPLFENPRADALLGIFSAAAFEHDRLDSLQME